MPITLTLVGIVTDDSEVHPLKASVPITLTLVLISMWPEQQAVEGLFLLTHPVVVVAVVARNKLLTKHKENVNRKELAPAIL